MKKYIVGLALTLTLTGYAAQDTEAAASAIIRFGEQQMRGLTTQAAMMMTIKKPDFTRKLQLRSWTVGGEKALVEILKPEKEEGISSLRVADQMWNYLPKTDQVIRVPTSLMLQSWMGSDFTNDDLMKSSSLLRDYTHRIVKQDKQNILIECLPKPNAPVVWGKILYSARVGDWLPSKEAYYDESGKWVRTLTFTKFRKMDDRVVPTVVTVNVAESVAQTTTITYVKVLYDRKIDEEIFSNDLLRRTSQNGMALASGWGYEALAGKRPALQRTVSANKKVVVFSQRGGKKKRMVSGPIASRKSPMRRTAALGTRR